MSTACKVTPGKQFDDTEVWTPAKLNQLGKPTVEIEDNTIGADALIDEDVVAIVNAAQQPAGVTGRKNLVINGSFDIWQRGTSFATNIPSGTPDIIWTADRWGTTSHNASRTILRAAFALGQTTVPGYPRYALRWVQASAPDVNPTYLGQRISGVHKLSNGKATLSAWLRPDVACTVTLQLVQHFGTGGAPSAAVGLAGFPKLLTADIWQRVSATFDLPTVVGKVVGTDATKGDWLELRFNMPQDIIYTIDFSQVQVEPGAVANAYEVPDPAVEEICCLPFYEQKKTTLSSAFTNLHPMVFYARKRYVVDPVVLDIIGDAGPYAQYFNGIDLGGAEQVITHGQTIATLEMDAELSR